MIGNFPKPKVTRNLSAILLITLLGGLSAWSSVLRDAEAQTDIEEEFRDELRKLKSELDTVKSQLNAVIETELPVGTIVPFGGSAEAMRKLEAKGWLFCDGRKLERRRYEELYDAIGFAFGKPDENTFNLPDLSGRFVRGVSHGSGNDPDAGSRTASAPGGNTGDKVGSVQDDQFNSHRHTVKAKHASRIGGRSKGDPIAVAGWSYNPADKEVEPSGGAETRPKNIYVNWIIKAKPAE